MPRAGPRPPLGPADDRDGHIRPAHGPEARTGWGCETLVREVSDSLHLRRFCLIALGATWSRREGARRLHWLREVRPG